MVISNDETLNAQSTSACASNVKEENHVDDEYVRIRILHSDTGGEVCFRVKAATALGRLKRSYCKKLGLAVEEFRFIYDGHRITDEDTPEKLQMVNDDIIETYRENTGGM